MKQLGPLYAGKLVEIEPERLALHGLPRCRRSRLRRRADRPASYPVRRRRRTAHRCRSHPFNKRVGARWRFQVKYASLLAWDEELGKSCAGLPLPEQRLAIADALEERATRRRAGRCGVGLRRRFTVPGRRTGRSGFACTRRPTQGRTRRSSISTAEGSRSARSTGCPTTRSAHTSASTRAVWSRPSSTGSRRNSRSRRRPRTAMQLSSGSSITPTSWTSTRPGSRRWRVGRRQPRCRRRADGRDRGGPPLALQLLEVPGHRHERRAATNTRR